jgi:hypothetical protein
VRLSEYLFDRLRIPSASQWVSVRLPWVLTTGLLAFDYVSPLLPEASTPIRADHDFTHWLSALKAKLKTMLSDEPRSTYHAVMVAIAHLRAAHIECGLSAAQLRLLLHALPKPLQPDATVALWSRVTDAQHFVSEVRAHSGQPSRRPKPKA